MLSVRYYLKIFLNCIVIFFNTDEQTWVLSTIEIYIFLLILRQELIKLQVVLKISILLFQSPLLLGLCTITPGYLVIFFYPWVIKNALMSILTYWKFSVIFLLIFNLPMVRGLPSTWNRVCYFIYLSVKCVYVLIVTHTKILKH